MKIELSSTCLSGAEYDGETLTVRFPNGCYYRYPNMPLVEVEALANTESAGKHYHKRIKNHGYLEADNDNFSPEEE